MVGNNLKDTQLQQIVDKTILFADKDEDGKISFEEFCAVSSVLLYYSFYIVNINVLINMVSLLGGREHGCAQKNGRRRISFG